MVEPFSEVGGGQGGPRGRAGAGFSANKIYAVKNKTRVANYRPYAVLHYPMQSYNSPTPALYWWSYNSPTHAYTYLMTVLHMLL